MTPIRAQILSLLEASIARAAFFALIAIIVLLLRTRSFGVRPVEVSMQPL